MQWLSSQVFNSPKAPLHYFGHSLNLESFSSSLRSPAYFLLSQIFAKAAVLGFYPWPSLSLIYRLSLDQFIQLLASNTEFHLSLSCAAKLQTCIFFYLTTPGEWPKVIWLIMSKPDLTLFPFMPAFPLGSLAQWTTPLSSQVLNSEIWGSSLCPPFYPV